MAIHFEVLAYESTPLGDLCLRRRELLSQPGVVVTEVTLNHEFLMSSLYTDSEQALANLAVQLHGGKSLRVLVGGLGLGYTAHAAAQLDAVEQIDVIELLPPVIQWLRDGLIPLSTELAGNPHVAIQQGDVYKCLAPTESTKSDDDHTLPSETYDIILIDVDHSPDDRLGDDSFSFYTTAGLQAARKRLAANGVLGVWSYAESSPFADAMRTVFDDVQVTPVRYHNELVDEHPTDWLFFGRNTVS